MEGGAPRGGVGTGAATRPAPSRAASCAFLLGQALLLYGERDGLLAPLGGRSVMVQAARHVAPKLLDVVELLDAGPWAPQQVPQAVVDHLVRLLGESS